MELPLKSCIDLVQIEHPDFGHKIDMPDQASEFHRMTTVDLFSGKEPYFFLQEYVFHQLGKSRQKLTVNELRSANTVLRDKIEAADDFFDIPQASKQPDPKVEQVKAGGYRPSLQSPMVQQGGGYNQPQSANPYQPQAQSMQQAQINPHSVYANYNRAPAGSAAAVFGAGVMAGGAMRPGWGYRGGIRPGYGRFHHGGARRW